MNIFYSVLAKLIPEITILRKKISWNEYVDYMYNCVVSSKSKIDPPYNLQNVKVGDYSYLCRNSFVSNTNIGRFCSIGPNFFCGWGIHPTDGISTSPMFYSTHKQNGMTLSKADKIDERKPIEIENDVFIGANVTILDGMRIGSGAVIGTGAVVSKEIPPYAIAVGSPIKITRYRFEKEIINALLKIGWWNFNDERLKDIESMFFDVQSFIKKYEK